MNTRCSPRRTHNNALGGARGRRPGLVGARGAALFATLALALAGCSDGEAAAPPKGAPPYAKLSDYGFFSGPLALEAPAAPTFRYEVSAPLWSDGALKSRFIALPGSGDAMIEWNEREDWGFPVGTALVKTFAFAADRRVTGGPKRIIETRILLHEQKGWTGHTYVWNDAQTEATRLVAGTRVNVDYIDEDGAAKVEEYIVPNTNQCKSCHSRDDEMHQLGITTPMINREVMKDGSPQNQLDALAAAGVFTSPPPASKDAAAFPDPYDQSLPVEPRARAYLSGNCAHCHRPGGGGGDSGLVLLPWEDNPQGYGVCKSPAAAGSGTGNKLFDVTPGSPDDSIMIYRMSSTDPEIKMPELPNRIPDAKGIALIRDWIAGLTPKGCP